MWVYCVVCEGVGVLCVYVRVEGVGTLYVCEIGGCGCGV